MDDESVQSIKIPGRKIVAIAIILIVAAIHAFRLGALLNGEWYLLYYSYFSDIVAPFGFYFALCITDSSIPFLRSWKLKALLVFGASTATEVAQAFGYYALGTTYDTLDIVMFGVGVSMAVALDRLVFARYLSFWDRFDSRTE